VIDWAMSNAMAAERATLPALSMAIGNRPFNEGLIFHFDRGCRMLARTSEIALEMKRSFKVRVERGAAGTML